MDSDLIYVKSTSGEEAMHKRTRVMQRNVRMVLILVDGHSTVADLCLKTGNQKLTENALSELEKGGFIELKVEQDSLWEESKQVAQEIKTATVNKAIKIASSIPKNTSPGSVPAESETRIFVHSVFPIPTQGDSSISKPSLAPMSSVLVPAEESSSAITQEIAIKPAKKRVRKKAQPETSFVYRIKTLITRAKRKADDSASINPPRRRQRFSIGWPAILMSSIVSVLVLAFLAINAFPYDRYLPELEAAFAQACGRPVKVGTMSVNIYPKPGLVLGGVLIGTEKDVLRIAEIRLQPVISSVMASKIIFRDVVVKGTTLSAELIADLPAVFASISKSTAKAGFQHLGFEQTEASFAGLGFSGMEGEAIISAGGVFQSLLMQSADRSLKLEMRPLAQGFDVSLEAIAWRPAQNSLFIFDSANLKGAFKNGVFTISKMELRIFDGLIQGVAILRSDKKPGVLGEILVERVNAARLGDALGIGQQFSGEITGKLRFSAIADSWPTIFSALDADGEFAMRRGVIRGIDLIEAVRRVSRTPVQGGTTQFEQLSGKIRLTPSSYQFQNLILSSGLMQSTGSVEVSKDLMMNGKMELRLRGSVNQTRIPIAIGGSLKNPVVQSGKF